MKLQISYNGKNYLAKVKKEKYNYIFELVRYNDSFVWVEKYGFQHFSCSLKCRLKHYKDFKKKTFDNPYGTLKKFKEI